MPFRTEVLAVEGGRMMFGLHAAVTREQGLLSAPYRATGVLSAAALSVLVLATIAAAPAAANVFDPVGAVTINGAPARQCGANGGSFPTADYCVGSAPLVTVSPPSNAPGGDFPNVRHLGVKNDETDGFDEITAVNATINPGSGQAEFASASSSSPLGPVQCNPGSGLTFKCSTFPAQRGFFAAVTYDLIERQSDYHGGLQRVDVEFNYGNAISACAGPAAPGQAPDTARAADSCTPPSNTRITQAKINRNTAFFRFTARHAASFECELLRNGRVMFRRSCRSPKPYANALPRGKYAFVLTSVNRAGVDPKPATKKFTVN
ncbi:hypothetical protein AYO39_02180 [Actinobacteria bacterium SCGC AG-212-D09]|nr:hypothetical protein AYO39_02180 [Actinobacteria bacterium SCGC AG-212-D09]